MLPTQFKGRLYYGPQSLRHASFGLRTLYITISILIEHSIMIRYSITIVIYCHIDMHCRSLLCVPEYISSQYPNNANPSIFSTINKLHYMLCSCVRVCLWRTDGQSSEFANVFHPLYFHHTV